MINKTDLQTSDSLTRIRSESRLPQAEQIGQFAEQACDGFLFFDSCDTC